MNEKTLVEEQPISATISSPPSYDCIRQSPPPPTYLQSARLHYKNQPFISESEQDAYYQEHQQRLHDHYADDTWSDIANLPLHQRMRYYLKSWANTVYDGRLVFLAFFVLGSLAIMAIVVSIIAIPSILKH
ncbi:hypothetical protein INT48_006289 [Thamnidium elegans]|uniref:Uncharacterized protein n=1 Tax=Thamnidium elegans TaxID=101142 RepID=A0A8H7VVD7_9FUNG|nr:hypothetical protein INT48_006289 [Thamnidium elegans]